MKSGNNYINCSHIAYSTCMLRQGLLSLLLQNIIFLKSALPKRNYS